MKNKISEKSSFRINSNTRLTPTPKGADSFLRYISLSSLVKSLVKSLLFGATAVILSLSYSGLI